MPTATPNIGQHLPCGHTRRKKSTYNHRTVLQRIKQLSFYRAQTKTKFTHTLLVYYSKLKAEARHQVRPPTKLKFIDPDELSFELHRGLFGGRRVSRFRIR